MKEQIELIRKDLNSLYKYRQDDFNYISCHNDIIRHLNSIEEISKKISKYKNAWEELLNLIKNDKIPKLENILGDESRNNLLFKISKIKQKYGIGVE